MPEVVIFIGLQASGKSSFYRARFAETHRLVSKDLYRRSCNKGQRQLRELAEALESGRSVVVDNTNPTLEDRALIIEQARGVGATVLGYYFESNLADCLVRNAGREGKARVPDHGIIATAKRLLPPTLSEGFAELWHVRIKSSGEQVVFAWNEHLAFDVFVPDAVRPGC